MQLRPDEKARLERMFDQLLKTADRAHDLAQGLQQIPDTWIQVRLATRIEADIREANVQMQIALGFIDPEE